MVIAKYYINVKYYQCYYVVCLHGLVLFMWPVQLIVINSWLYANSVDVEVTTLCFCSHLVRWTPSKERAHPNGIALVLLYHDHTVFTWKAENHSLDFVTAGEFQLHWGPGAPTLCLVALYLFLLCPRPEDDMYFNSLHILYINKSKQPDQKMGRRFK